MDNRYSSADALILRISNYGEGNRIYTLFDRKRGKFSAAARGVRKAKSKLNGHLQLGCRCHLQLTKGKGNGPETIVSASAAETFASNRNNSGFFFYTSYFLELTNDFIPEEYPEPEIFDLLCAVLAALPDTEPALLARFFEIKLLESAGFSPDFSICALCGKPLKEAFSNSNYSGLICGSCGSGTPLSPKAVFALRYLSSTDLPGARRLKIGKDTLIQLGRVTSGMAERCAERKIRSLDILNQIEALDTDKNSRRSMKDLT